MLEVRVSTCESYGEHEYSVYVPMEPSNLMTRCLHGKRKTYGHTKVCT